MTKKLLAAGALSLGFLANPYLACSESGQSDFTYSEADMKQAVLGTWQGSAELDGESTPFSLSLEQAASKSKAARAAAPRVEPECGSRSFVRPAAACLAETRMPLVGALSSESPALNGAVDGYVVAYRTLDSVQLELRLDSGVVLSGQLEAQALSEGSLKNAGQAGSFTLARP